MIFGGRSIDNPTAATLHRPSALRKRLCARLVIARGERRRTVAVVVRLTHLVLAHRRTVVVGWLLVVVAGMWAAATITDSLSQSFEAPGRPAFDPNRESVRTFGNGGVVPPLVAVGDGDAAGLQAVARSVSG